MTQPSSEALPYYFDDALPAVCFNRHETPTPWINYLSNGSLHGFVSQAGGGLLWWRGPLIFRLTRYRMYNLPIDSPGFYIYLRRSDGVVWSPTFRPVETPLDSWQARHEPGCSVFTASKDGVTAELSLFVAPDAETLVWDLRLKNGSGAAVEMDLFAYVELSLLEWLQEAQWGCYIKSMINTWYDEKSRSQLYLYHHQSHPRLNDIPLVYLASTRDPIGWDGDRDSFVGPYRYERNPVAVERGECFKSSLLAGEACAALQNKITVQPGEEERISYFLGCMPGALGEYHGTLDKLGPELERFRAPGWVDAQREKVRAWWKEHLSIFDSKIPDADAQRQINIWTPIQCVHTGRYSRSISFYATGIRGLGYRDTLQDMLAVAYRKPAWAQQTFLYQLTQQFEDGHAVHTCWPEDKQPPSKSIHSDDHLWLPMVAYALVAETGCADFLSEKVPFLNKEATGPASEATAWEHLMRAMEFTENNLGSHGLPLTLRSDWNDIIGKFAREGRGESVFAAQQYLYVLRQMLELARFQKDSAAEARIQGWLEKQQQAIEKHTWDGDWWVRCFDDNGAPIGSQQCEYGKIFINTQSWSVMSACGTVEQRRQAMQSVHDKLNTELGIQKLWPSFKTYPEDSDAFSGYSPGCGENGAIFCHANTWAIIAEALLGNGERAWKYFRQLVPHVALQKAGMQRYQAEPYAYASNIIGPENPRFGWANVSQVTGTATWMDVAATQYLLGVRPELNGIRIEPCLPPDWKGVEITRVWRGTKLNITVKNSSGKGSGVHELRVEGSDVNYAASGVPIIPAAVLQGRAEVSVEVVL